MLDAPDAREAALIESLRETTRQLRAFRAAVLFQGLYCPLPCRDGGRALDKAEAVLAAVCEPTNAA